MKGYLTKDIQTSTISRQIEGMRVGRIVSIDELGQVFVDFPDNTNGAVAARFTSSLKLQRLRKAISGCREVLLVFENNDLNLPIIIDTMHSLLDEAPESSNLVLEAEKLEDVIVDGKRVIFDAKDEVVLRCGKASITLTRAGKVLIRGEYLLSRSSGVNRIKGGSVQIN
jgi:hypothetical protein